MMLYFLGTGFISANFLFILYLKWKAYPLILTYRKINYEFIYFFLGCKGCWDDFKMRKSNRIEIEYYPSKVALITGGTRGIGVEVIRKLIECQMQVIIGCRNVSAGHELLKKFESEGYDIEKVQVYQLDVSEIDSIKQFCEKINDIFPKINYLINNAGIMFGPYRETSKGFEAQLATNYLGHFYLTHLLLDKLRKGGQRDSFSRIVNVSSLAHLLGEINYGDINYKEQYVPGLAYAQSKLAQIMFSNYLDKILRQYGDFVQVHSVHPGIVDTGLIDNTTPKKLMPWLVPILFKTPAQGARSIVYACISPKLEGYGGTYINNCEIYPPKNIATDEYQQKLLFEFTKNLLEIKDFGEVEN